MVPVETLQFFSVPFFPVQPENIQVVTPVFSTWYPSLAKIKIFLVKAKIIFLRDFFNSGSKY